MYNNAGNFKIIDHNYISIGRIKKSATTNLNWKSLIPGTATADCNSRPKVSEFVILNYNSR